MDVGCWKFEIGGRKSQCSVFRPKTQVGRGRHCERQRSEAITIVRSSYAIKLKKNKKKVTTLPSVGRPAGGRHGNLPI